MPSAFSLNLVELGHIAAYLAFAVALIQGLAPLLARIFNNPSLARLSVSAAPTIFFLTTLGGIALIQAFLASNFSVRYVAATSNTLLPTFYKVAALWGGHEGSLYLWAWILTGFTFVVSLHGRKRYAERLPVIMAVQGWLVVGFFGLILFLSNPFLRAFPVPVEGQDLNPLLQDPGMVIHPPMLYLGYVGFSVPFAFAMAALITNWKSEHWIGHIRRWALVAWGFLTAGIVLGAWWSYYELGWGGYWAWDPVENASFMPWLMGTALIHSITVQERRRMLHAWNIFLVITTFSLSLLGTFLVRSGVLSSVHAFAVDPGRGAYILGFMVVALTVSFGLFLWKGRYQAAEESFNSALSRESFFVWNNVVFTVATACVLLGTLYPLALEAFTGAKITVGPPYFNLVMVPLFLLIVLLMGIAPLLPWRKANTDKLKTRLRVPAVLGLVVAAATAAIFWPLHWTGPAAFGLVAFVSASLWTDLWRTARQRARQFGEGAAVAIARTIGANRRHYGGMLVHFGVLIVALGLTGAGLFRLEKAVLMAPGEVVEIGPERLRFEGVSVLQRDNYTALQGRLVSVDKGYVLTPERRRYPVQEMPTTEAGLDSTLLRDVYAVIGEPVGERYAIHIYLNPLVNFIWLGTIVMLLGLTYNLSYAVRRAARARVPANAVTR